MKSVSKIVLLAFSFLALLSACETTPPAAISVALSPDTADVIVTQSVQLMATVHNSTNSVVTWSLSGAGCSGATCGTISSTGLYTAPASVPNPAIVTVKATSVADTSKSASATITIHTDVNLWTWVSGSNTYLQKGIYGTKGTAASSNIPGARNSAVSWLDSSGKLWLFGGDGYDSTGTNGALNDLWKYDPTTNEWTWVSGSNTVDQTGIYGTKGTAAPSNLPGARGYAVSWIDSSGNLWLFGGAGFDSAGNRDDLNDLWKYDPTTDEWTWVSGSNTCLQKGIYGTKGTATSSNIPGTRNSAVSWIDSSGKLWLFGGSGFDWIPFRGFLNDLWKYDPITNEWTWVSGNNIVDQAGSYGTQGIAASSNIPGARRWPISWIDSSGNLWLFGGQEWLAGYINDLWKYDPTANEWTWVSGSSTGYQAGIYGTKGTAASSNIPGARVSAVSWLDSSSKLWLFGGSGHDSAADFGILNDLWKYDPITNEWTWVSGSNTRNQAGIPGTKGTAASSNIPGARNVLVSWLDSSGKLWLFGGDGYDSAGNQGLLNDLWQYIR